MWYHKRSLLRVAVPLTLIVPLNLNLTLALSCHLISGELVDDCHPLSQAYDVTRGIQVTILTLRMRFRVRVAVV
jgi:hypothetical protein